MPNAVCCRLQDAIRKLLRDLRTRCFYRYTPPRPLEEIEADIRVIEGEIVRMLAEVMGGQAG